MQIWGGLAENLLSLHPAHLSQGEDDDKHVNGAEHQKHGAAFEPPIAHLIDDAFVAISGLARAIDHPKQVTRVVGVRDQININVIRRVFDLRMNIPQGAEIFDCEPDAVK